MKERITKTKGINLLDKNRLNRLVKALEEIVERQKTHSSGLHIDETRGPGGEKRWSPNGELVYTEGYDKVGWPGVATISQYRAFSDGILKLEIFMDEEDNHLLETTLYSPKRFSSYLKEQAMPAQLRNYLIDELRRKIRRRK